MTTHKDLHPKDGVDRLYVSRKRGRELVSIKDSVDASIQRLEDFIEKRGGGLITATGNNTDNSSINRKINKNNGKKHNSMDISSDKQTKSHMRKPKAKKGKP